VVAVVALPVVSPEPVIYPAPLVIALLFNEIFAEPSNETPAIVLAVARVVAVAAKATAIFADPSKLVPPIVLAVVNVPALVAVAALPVHDPDDPDTLPVTPPTKFPIKVPVVTVKLPVELAVPDVVPIKNLSSDSSQPINALSPVLPLSINKPQSLAFELAPLFNSSRLSSSVVFAVATVVVVPLTVKLPVTTTSSLNVLSPATVCAVVKSQKAPDPPTLITEAALLPLVPSP